MENNQIINDWIKAYLIGPMEEVAEGDGGRGWRLKIREEFAKRLDSNQNPVYIFDPTLEEQNKVDMEPEACHKKIKGWLASGHNDKIKEHGNLIWKGKTYLETTEEGQAKLIHIMGDIDYVKNSDFLIARMEPKDKPCGTYMEVGIALEHNIPIYIIQTMARTEYSLSFVMAILAGGGDFFDNPSQLFEFVDKKYKLKVKK